MNGIKTHCVGKGPATCLAALMAASSFFVGCEGETEPGAPAIARVDTQATTAERAGFDVELDGEPAPFFTLMTLDGEILTLEDLEGDVVVLNFWATWCAPCRVEIPDLIEMQDSLEEEGVRFVGISMDHDGAEVVRAYAEEVGFNYPVVMDDGEVADAFGGVYALPTTILIDRDGNVRRKISGLVTTRFLMPLLEELAGI